MLGPEIPATFHHREQHLSRFPSHQAITPYNWSEGDTQLAEYLVKWTSGRGQISKIGPSDGCGRDTVPLAGGTVVRFPRIWMSSGKCRISGSFMAETVPTGQIKTLTFSRVMDSPAFGITAATVRLQVKQLTESGGDFATMEADDNTEFSTFLQIEEL